MMGNFKRKLKRAASGPAVEQTAKLHMERLLAVLRRETIELSKLFESITDLEALDERRRREIALRTRSWKNKLDTLSSLLSEMVDFEDMLDNSEETESLRAFRSQFESE